MIFFTSLFKDNFMCKPKKSALTKVLHLQKPSITQGYWDDLEKKTIVDGGGFLHAVVWKPLPVFGEELNNMQVDRHYRANAIFVFKDLPRKITSISDVQ